MTDVQPAGAVDRSGELVLRRADDTVGVLLPLKITVDGARAASLLPNQAVALLLAPGTHRVRAGRSRILAVDVAAGGTVHVSAGHPPMPGYWRMVFAPFRSTRPSLTVTPGAQAVPGPGEPTAAEVWLKGWVPSFVRFNLWLIVAVGCVLFVAGGAFAVVGGGEPFVVIGGLVSVAGLVVAGAGVWLVHRAARIEDPAP